MAERQEWKFGKGLRLAWGGEQIKPCDDKWVFVFETTWRSSKGKKLRRLRRMNGRMASRSGTVVSICMRRLVVPLDVYTLDYRASQKWELSTIVPCNFVIKFDTLLISTLVVQSSLLLPLCTYPICPGWPLELRDARFVHLNAIIAEIVSTCKEYRWKQKHWCTCILQADSLEHYTFHCR